MKQLKKSLTVPTIIVCAVGWGWFSSKAIESKEEPSNTVGIIKSIDDINRLSITRQLESSKEAFYAEYERLKEEERKRLEELERQRLERLEQIRLAKIEESKKLEQKKRIAEQKKRWQVVSRGSSDETIGNWMTFNATYYGNDCNGCGNYTYTGINVSSTIYYKGYRIVASDKNVLPMGTLVDIKTPNERFKGIIADIGGGIRGKRLDVLVTSEAIATQIGRHDVQVRIIGKIDIN